MQVTKIPQSSALVSAPHMCREIMKDHASGTTVNEHHAAQRHRVTHYNEDLGALIRSIDAGSSTADDAAQAIITKAETHELSVT